MKRKYSFLILMAIIWVIPVNAQWSSPTQLTFNFVDDKSPDISDDGSKIAFRSFSDIRGESWVVNSDGSGLLQLSSNWNYNTVISGDGSKIAFSALIGEYEDLCIINPDGSGLNTIASAESFWGISINRDGSKIAYTPEHQNIFIVNADGSNSTQLTNFWLTDEPSINADGSKIAFIGLDQYLNLYIINSDGSNLTQLTHNMDCDHPSISADGSKIAFMSNLDGDREIFFINSDGSNLTQLTSNIADDSSPSISADGSKIAFMSNLDGDYEIYIINSDGSDLTQLTSNTAVDGSPSINEDGSKIAFCSNVDGDYEIFVIERLDDNDGSISGVVSHSYIGGGQISGVTVHLKQGGTVIGTTTTPILGEYSFADLSPGTYDIEFSKPQFYDEIDSANVVAGINTIVNINLRLKGDLDNNGQQADAVDVNMMIQASVGDIPSDRYFDLDNNVHQADAGDVNMMIQASVGDIILKSLETASVNLPEESILMADSFGVNDASGSKSSKLSVPFEIVNAANGSLQTIKFSMDYNESVISLKSVERGSLTSGWIVTLGKDKHSITLTTVDNTNTIPNGSTGIAGYLNFKVVGKPGKTTSMSTEGTDFSNINNEHGVSVLEKNGIFTVMERGRENRINENK